MNDASGVGCVQRICHFDTQRDGSRDIEGLAADVLAKRLTVEQLHHQKRMARRLTDVVYCANIGMIQRRSGACLALDTLSGSLRCKWLRQNLDGNLAIEPRVPRLIYLTHAALPDGGKDLVRAEFRACGQRHV